LKVEARANLVPIRLPRISPIFLRSLVRGPRRQWKYLQQIKFRSAKILPETSIKVGDVQLKHREDYVALPPYTSETVDVSGGLVLVGYVVVSTDLRRDNLAGLDSKEKS